MRFESLDQRGPASRNPPIGPDVVNDPEDLREIVGKNGFEYDGQCYRSLTVIAEKITGAHWSGPRFFGLTKRASASAGTEAGR